MKKIIGILVMMILIAATVLPVVGIMNNIITEEKRISSNPDILIWHQGPDVGSTGIDIRCDSSDGVMRILASDFECTVTGYLTRIEIYGSWKDDVKGTMDRIYLSIHENIPVGPHGYSIPGGELWSEDFGVAFIDEEEYSINGEPQWWWDRYYGEPIEHNHRNIYLYIINIPADRQFFQTGTSDIPVIYWLDVWVETRGGEFGWKTTHPRFIDDAVYMDSWWKDLHYPEGHPYHILPDNSLDLAMGIWGKESLPPPVVIIDTIPGFNILDIMATVINTGDLPISAGVACIFEIDAPIMLMGAESTFLIEEPLGPGQEVEIKSSTIFGLGYATISIQAILDNEIIGEETVNGFILGPFIYIKE